MSIPNQMHALKRLKSQGFTLLELIVVACIVAIVATFGTDKLFWYQGQAEKANMELTANIVKSTLWTSAAGLMMANKGSEIPSLLEKNPFNLLAEKPSNYLGEFQSNQGNTLASGNWYYDASTHEIVYILAHRKGFTSSSADAYTVRYGMKLLQNEIEVSPGKKVQYVAGITLLPKTQYTWQ